MASIHYFQRYSSKENVVTNNTLLLLARLYETSTVKFQLLLNELLQEEVEVGLSFNQQIRGTNSVPDGTIFQKSFKIVIETKLGDNYQVSQLVNHLNSLGDEDYQVLLAIGSKEMKPKQVEQINNQITDFNKTNGKRVKFISTSFSLLIESFGNALNDYDFELIRLIDDYRGYCHSEGLIPNDDYLMRLVLCSDTLEENFVYNLYYSDRGFRDHRYIGIYKNKAIRGIGKIENIIFAKRIGGILKVESSTTIVTADQQTRINGAIDKAMQVRGSDLTFGLYFFCVEKFERTEFRKTSKGAPMGTKFFDLRRTLNLKALPDTSEIANLLKNVSWT